MIYLGLYTSHATIHSPSHFENKTRSDPKHNWNQNKTFFKHYSLEKVSFYCLFCGWVTETKHRKESCSCCAICLTKLENIITEYLIRSCPH